MGIKIKPQNIQRPTGKLWSTTKGEFEPAPFCSILLDQYYSDQEIQNMNLKVGNDWFSTNLQIKRAKYQLFARENKIWNFQNKRTKRSGDNGSWDDPSDHIYVEQGYKVILDPSELIKHQKQQQQQNNNENNNKIQAFIAAKNVKEISEKTNVFYGYITTKYARSGYIKPQNVGETFYFRATEIKAYDWSRVKRGDVFSFTLIKKANKIQVRNMIFQRNTAAPRQVQINNNRNRNKIPAKPAWHKKNNNNMDNNNNKIINNNNRSKNKSVNQQQQPKKDNFIQTGVKKFNKIPGINKLNQFANAVFNDNSNVNNNNNTSSTMSDISPISSPAITTDNNIPIITSGDDIEIADKIDVHGKKRERKEMPKGTVELKEAEKQRQSKKLKLQQQKQQNKNRQQQQQRPQTQQPTHTNKK